MNAETEVPYYCPYCENETSIIVSIGGPSNYHVVDECCPNCDAQIEGGTLDEMVVSAVADYFYNRGETACENPLEKEFQVLEGVPPTDE